MQSGGKTLRKVQREKLSGKEQEGLTVHGKVTSHEFTSFKPGALPGSSWQVLRTDLPVLQPANCYSANG